MTKQAMTDHGSLLDTAGFDLSQIGMELAASSAAASSSASGSGAPVVAGTVPGGGFMDRSCVIPNVRDLVPLPDDKPKNGKKGDGGGSGPPVADSDGGGAPSDEDADVKSEPASTKKNAGRHWQGDRAVLSAQQMANVQLTALRECVKTVKALLTQASEKMTNMADEDKQFYKKEEVLLGNRPDMVEALLDPAPVRLQCWISDMAATTISKAAQAKAGGGQAKHNTFLPGAPCKNFHQAVTLDSVSQTIASWTADAKKDLDALSSEFKAYKALITDMVSAAKGRDADINKAIAARERVRQTFAENHATADAKQQAEAAKRQGDVLGGSAPKRRVGLPALAGFEVAEQVGCKVKHNADRANPDDFVASEPYLVPCLPRAAALREGPLMKQVLQEFGEAFSEFAKKSPLPRAQKHIADPALAERVRATLLEDLFGDVIGAAVPPISPPAALDNKGVLEPCLFGIGPGLEFECSDKEAAGNLRLILQGTRSLVLVYGPDFIKYMEACEPRSAALANPHKMQRAYSFLKMFTADMARQYISQGNKIFFVTNGPGDCLYFPA